MNSYFFGLIMSSFVAIAHIVWTWVRAWQNGRSAHHRPPTKTAVPHKWPLISIIIPAWEEQGTIEPCIASLRQVLFPEWEAFVVAGGDDGTYEAALAACDRDPRLRVLQQQPSGKNAALNTGLAMSRGSVIVLLDADSRVLPFWLKALVAPIAAGETAVTTGRYLPLRHTPITRYATMTRIAAYEVAQKVTLQGSGSIALTRWLIDGLGGFAEDVPVGVDWDLHVRVQEAGVQPIYCHTAGVQTSRPATLREFWVNDVRWRRAHLAALWRHHNLLLTSVPKVIEHLLFYGLSLVMGLWTAVLISALLSDMIPFAIVLGIPWLLIMTWMLGRRAAMVGLVAAYENNWRWLRDMWVPPILLLLSMAASAWALLTTRHLSPHFKGPRVEVIT